MRDSICVLELADGTRLSVPASPDKGEPIVFSNRIPSRSITAFSDSNPPRGTYDEGQRWFDAGMLDQAW